MSESISIIEGDFYKKYRIFFLSFYIVLSIIEITFFCDFPNIVGCGITLFSLFIFNKYVFRERIVKQRSLSFFSLVLPYLFMILPLPATLIDGNPISYGMKIPVVTFTLQGIYFGLIVWCFLKVGNKKIKIFSLLLRRIDVTPSISNGALWCLGFMGLMFHMFTYFLNMGAGILNMLSLLMFSPICILYAKLIGKKECNTRQKCLVWGYMFFIAIIMIGSNSRSKCLSPFVVCFLLYVLYRIQGYSKIRTSFKRFFAFIILFYFVIGPVKDFAFSMVIVRAERGDISKRELILKTWEVYNDKKTLYELQEAATQLADDKANSYVNGSEDDWDENYVSNLFLSRVCNYKVADASIYHAYKAGMPNNGMFHDLIIRIFLLLPSPIINFFCEMNKDEFAYSPMDYLFAVSTKSEVFPRYIVGGDVGLGMASLGFFFFPVLMLIFSMEFLVFNSLSRTNKDNVLFSVVSIIWIYNIIFLRFQVGSGITGHLSFLLWNMPIALLLYLFVIRFVRAIFHILQ